jgi:phage gp45-like
MKARNGLFSLALCFVVAASCVAQAPHMGTWNMNEAKSKIPAGVAKNTTVVYTAEGDNIKVTTDGTLDGKTTHSEWTGKFDGKDYPVTGLSAGDTRSYKQINDHTLSIAIKQGGKVTSSGKVVVSADGKTRTVDLKGTDSAGKKVSSVAVYDKQ